MSHIQQTAALNSIIHSLEEKRLNELSTLKAQLRLTGESMKPSNLIKTAANELTGNKTIKTALIQAAIGLAIGFATKKIMAANKTSSPSNFIGNMAEMGLHKLTGNRSALIKIAAPIIVGFIVNLIKNRRRRSA